MKKVGSRVDKVFNNRWHGDGYFVAAAHSLKSRTCCGRYKLV
jgi:hypothetical protein